MIVLVSSLIALGIIVIPDAVLATIGTSHQYELDLIRWLGLAAVILVVVEAAGRRFARPVSPPSVVLRLVLPVVAFVYVLSGDGLFLILLFSLLVAAASYRAMVTVEHVTAGLRPPAD